MLRNDFDLVLGLKAEFFAQRQIQLQLAKMERDGIAGWKSWWRVEFARFLQRHRDGHEWALKHPLELERAMGAETDELTADFMIKPRYGRCANPILLELEQSDSIEGCITSMAQDIHTVYQRESISLNHRNLWVVGVHPRENKQAVRDTVECVATYHGITLFDVCTRYILHTGYAFTIF